ncbi:hypothetical protein ACOMHN_065713 [Nucella lapillus]
MLDISSGHQELEEMLHEDLGDASLNAVQKLLEDLLAGRMPSADVACDEALTAVSEKLEQQKEELAHKRTSALWLQYMKMVDILKSSIKAERTGNFDLYLQYLENNVRCAGQEQTMSNFTSPDSNLSRFSGWYAAYHGYVSLCVCLSGIITNTFNVTVLTRRKMRTPVNQILTGLAFSDIITMMSYVPFALHFYCLHPTTQSTAEKNSYGWMFFLLFHINLTNVTHTVSIWMCVVLAIVRYLHIRSPTRASSARFRRITQAKYLVMVVYVCSTIVMIPNYLTNELMQMDTSRRDTSAVVAGGNSSAGGEEGGGRIINESIWVLKSMRLGSNETETLVLINVWQFAVLAKLAPCFFMFIFGSLLLHQMRNKINQRRDFLKFSISNSSKLREHSRTTKMLIAVIVLFIITELPQGILIVLSATKEGFFNNVYLPLGDVMDIMALVNNAINFVLYCSMSTKFRETFLCLYCACRSYRPHDQDDRQEDHAENGYVLRDKADSCCSNN